MAMCFRWPGDNNLVNFLFYFLGRIILVIKSINSKKGKIEIDLTGPQGNAFFLLAQVENLCKHLKGKDAKEIQKRMKDSDYENLVKIFDGEFGK